jgi:hypothetical protein
LKDLKTNQMVVDFDTSYTKLSADSGSNYFKVYMDGLEPERYYQLMIKTTVGDETEEPLTIPEFFAEYDKLFFEIPQKGAGSHDEIVKRSSAYIGVTGQSEQIQALLDEINELRSQLLSAQQEIVNLSSNI